MTCADNEQTNVDSNNYNPGKEINNIHKVCRDFQATSHVDFSIDLSSKANENKKYMDPKRVKLTQTKLRKSATIWWCSV